MKKAAKNKTADELFGDAMSGVRSDYGRNKEARVAEIAIGEMRKRLKKSEKTQKELVENTND